MFISIQNESHKPMFSETINLSFNESLTYPFFVVSERHYSVLLKGHLTQNFKYTFFSSTRLLLVLAII